MKKTICVMLACILCFTAAMPLSLAADAGERRVAIGANLDDAQRAQIFADFGLTEGEVTEITVTNADERAYLAGLVPESKIGSVALSCIYIETLEKGAGLTVSTHNINWCTAEMYINALTTAGITDARVMVSAPFAVSGTAALTGAYRAYEDITGTTLSQIAKEVGFEELLVTGELTEYIGSDDAAALVNELKKILDQTQDMTDDEVREEIKAIAKAYNVSLTDAQIDQLVKLCRSMEKLDVGELQKRLVDLTNTVQGVQKAGNFISKVGEGIKNFFVSIGNFFSRLFGGKN
ncbi:DUF1002 domain-containing protein [Christensenellaceae bacterium OttesenSCG-928-L17]|nr:DUF1002 domain-containing protein [Christensenellaceae bacterium OttesenSCG-928-L17]